MSSVSPTKHRAAQRLANLLHTLRLAVLGAMEHDAFYLAQATAYSATFAIFPALIVAAAVVGMLPDAAPLRTQMSHIFGLVLPPNVSPVLDAYFTRSDSSDHTARVLIGSVVVTLTGASGVMTTLMEGFRRAHRLPLLSRRWLSRRIRALVLVPLSLLPMSAATMLVVFGHLLTHRVAHAVSASERAPVLVAAFLLRWTIALAGSVGIIAVIYHLGTDLTRGVLDHLADLLAEHRNHGTLQRLRRGWSWQASLPGATVATVLWFVSTLLFGVYVTRFANYSRVYGSLGAAIALMFWLYLIALSVLIGAEFNAQLTVQHRDPHLDEQLWKLPGLRSRRTGRITD